MEKKHKKVVIIQLLIVFIICYLLNINFSKISSETISIISIVLAMYAISISSLIGSNFAKMLKDTPHKTIKDQTELDVISNYYKNAMKIAITTIIIAIIYILFESQFTNLINSIIPISNNIIYNMKKIISSISFVVFYLNFMYVYLIFKFIVNRQLEDE